MCWRCSSAVVVLRSFWLQFSYMSTRWVWAPTAIYTLSLANKVSGKAGAPCVRRCSWLRGFASPLYSHLHSIGGVPMGVHLGVVGGWSCVTCQGLVPCFVLRHTFRRCRRTVYVGYSHCRVILSCAVGPYSRTRLGSLSRCDRWRVGEVRPWARCRDATVGRAPVAQRSLVSMLCPCMNGSRGGA